MKQRSNVIILVSYLLLAVIFLLDACQSRPSNEKKIIAPAISNLPQIDGFYIFKRNMSILEVSKLLTEQKIGFKEISIDKQDEIKYPLSIEFLISADELKNFKKIRIIEGINLSILNKELDKFQIGFFNNILFYFYYEKKHYAEYLPNPEHKRNIELIKEMDDDITLLKSFSEGLNYKYGNPVMISGDLDVFSYLTPPSDQWDDNKHKGTYYLGKQFWLSEDSVVQIGLWNEYFFDSSKLPPYKEIKEAKAAIEVLFNCKYIDEIHKFVLEKQKLQESTEKKRMDSLLKQKNKQFDGL